jgi:hypothetical protein
MAMKLRSFAGVRHVEAVGFAGWQPDPMDRREVPPWQPWGALLFVEAAGASQLDDLVNKIFGDMEEFDPDRMRLCPMDSF